MTEVQVLPLQLDETARALALAFQADPLQSYVLPDPEEREAVVLLIPRGASFHRCDREGREGKPEAP